jgi:small subunit ribosomal protein S1
MSEQAVEKESFAALLEESMGSKNNLVGQVIEGRVISVENDFALIDVGLKSEGRVLLKEFAPPGHTGRGGVPAG